VNGNGQRYLIVTADDFGIGPATSLGILDLAVQGLVTGTVLLVNSPYAEQGVRAWNQAGRPVEVGWHPALTIDRPVLRAECVPSLVDDQGRFWSLPDFLRKICLGRIRAAEVEAELRAQYQRFFDLVGAPPTVVNTHHHVQIFPTVGRILVDLLARQRPLPYVRRIRESWSTLFGVGGARVKRLALTLFGKRMVHRQTASGFPGNDTLIGVTDPPCVADEEFLTRWLAQVPGRVVELTCHPGYLDATLLGRDATPQDGQMRRRVHELERLRRGGFHQACVQAGFVRVAPGRLCSASSRESGHAA
jgi:predicted glycoside hydrolase/deacetylase ChbG (UPF0249 family)